MAAAKARENCNSIGTLEAVKPRPKGVEAAMQKANHQQCGYLVAAPFALARLETPEEGDRKGWRSMRLTGQRAEANKQSGT